MIELKGVSKSYNRGKVKAVDNLNLTIPNGKIFGFLGPNGAGKTTTIKMIVGLLRQDSGTIRVNGIDVSKDPLAVKRQLGYVPDNPDVYEKLTGAEYVNFIADVFQVPGEERKKRIPELLELFEMEAAYGDLIKSYSHGMQQKIILIASLVHDPEVLILDEPLTGLDPKSSRHLKEIVRERCDRGLTAFFSTHVLDVAERVCDELAIIDKGHLIAEGTMEELKQQAGDSETLESIFLKLTESLEDGDHAGK